MEKEKDFFFYFSTSLEASALLLNTIILAFYFNEIVNAATHAILFAIFVFISAPAVHKQLDLYLQFDVSDNFPRTRNLQTHPFDNCICMAIHYVWTLQYFSSTLCTRISI